MTLKNWCSLPVPLLIVIAFRARVLLAAGARLGGRVLLATRTIRVTNWRHLHEAQRMLVARVQLCLSGEALAVPWADASRMRQALSHEQLLINSRCS